jgi:hypothetical protein
VSGERPSRTAAPRTFVVANACGATTKAQTTTATPASVVLMVRNIGHLLFFVTVSRGRLTGENDTSVTA